MRNRGFGFAEVRAWPDYSFRPSFPGFIRVILRLIGILLCVVVALLCMRWGARAQEVITPVVVAPVSPADAGPWNQFWLQLQPALLTFALAVLGALGTVVTYFASKLGSAQATKAITSVYMTGVEAAAGWLQHKLAESGDPAAKSVSVDSPEVASAIAYFRTSFPADKVQPPDSELARDIVAIFAKAIRKPT